MHPNFATLRLIPILHVAQVLDLKLVKTGGGAYAMREENEVTSLVLFERTNTFHRFSGKERGGVSRGSVIDLVIHVHECSLQEAVDFLTSSFPQSL